MRVDLAHALCRYLLIFLAWIGGAKVYRCRQVQLSYWERSHPVGTAGTDSRIVVRCSIVLNSPKRRKSREERFHANKIGIVRRSTLRCHRCWFAYRPEGPQRTSTFDDWNRPRDPWPPRGGISRRFGTCGRSAKADRVDRHRSG